MSTMDILNRLDENTASVMKHFAELSDDVLNRSPNTGVWSIAQNLEHLIILNESYFPQFEQLKTGNLRLPFISRFDFLVKKLGEWILSSVQPDRKKKIKTFRLWEPNHNHKSGIIDRFSAHQEDLKAHFLALESKAGTKAVICSPANKNIAYHLDKAMEIIEMHERRHIEQAKEVLKQLRS